jgi:hypothetical protein
MVRVREPERSRTYKLPCTLLKATAVEFREPNYFEDSRGGATAKRPPRVYQTALACLCLRPIIAGFNSVFAERSRSELAPIHPILIERLLILIESRLSLRVTLI